MKLKFKLMSFFVPFFATSCASGYEVIKCSYTSIEHRYNNDVGKIKFAREYVVGKINRVPTVETIYEHKIYLKAKDGPDILLDIYNFPDTKIQPGDVLLLCFSQEKISSQTLVCIKIGRNNWTGVPVQPIQPPTPPPEHKTDATKPPEQK